MKHRRRPRLARRSLARFGLLLRDRRGATVIEYTLLLAFLGMAALATMELLEGDIESFYASLEGELEQAGEE